MNVCEPNLKATSSNFNRSESLTKKFCFHVIFRIWYVLLVITALLSLTQWLDQRVRFKVPSIYTFCENFKGKTSQLYQLLSCRIGRRLNFSHSLNRVITSLLSLTQQMVQSVFKWLFLLLLLRLMTLFCTLSTLQQW